MSPGKIRFIAIFVAFFMASSFDWLLSILFSKEIGDPLSIGILSACFAMTDHQALRQTLKRNNKPSSYIEPPLKPRWDQSVQIC
jgi:hypothetical protein